MTYRYAFSDIHFINAFGLYRIAGTSAAVDLEMGALVANGSAKMFVGVGMAYIF